MIDAASPNPRPLQVLVLDPFPAAREGLAVHVHRHPDLAICGQTADANDALQLARMRQPDVVVVAAPPGKGDEVAIVEQFKRLDDRIQLVVWSVFDSPERVEAAVRAGARGFVLKHDPTERLIRAIRSVCSGETFLLDAVDSAEFDADQAEANNDEHSPIEQLSDRERETFLLIGEGLDTHAVAERMQVSTKTVETYRARIKQKLKLNNGRELARRAFQWSLQHA
jgi:DNA-binding NarL/FixJ family response regulator